MENFIVSARKYRPQAFETVVGQQHVTHTLENAIRQNHLAQALLFTGPRGVGKTTCARILARMINAQPGDGPDADYSFNIFELDAASNNSVDDIRSLIDQVRFAPQTGQYKVYIIDEVHMLSTAAFNAFLKTLEEPPKHAIFILATTEKHKIIPTILSRCQIYDFKRITVEDITNHLRTVADKEGVNAEPDALHLIAQKADGALRDALSIFDRMVAFTGANLTYTSVAQNLNVLDYDYYFKAVDLALKGDAAGLLLLLDQVLEKGFDPHLFLTGLSVHLRDLLVGRDERTIRLLEVGEQVKKRYLEQSRQVEPGFLLNGLKLLNQADVQYKSSHNPRLLVEIALVQLIGSDEKKNPERVEDTPPKKADESGRAGESITKSGSPQVPESVSHEGEETVRGKVEETRSGRVGESITESTSSQVRESVSHEEGEIRSGKVVEAENGPSIPSGDSGTGLSEPVIESPTPQLPAPNRPAGRRTGFSIKEVLSGTDAANKSQDEEGEEDTSGMPQEPFALPDLMKHLREYSADLKEHKPVIYSTLANAKPEIEQGNRVVLVVNSGVNAGYIEDELRLLKRYLREKLNNYALHLETRVTEKEEVKSLYTPPEKYAHLLEKNPHLEQLRTKLDLELE